MKKNFIIFALLFFSLKVFCQKASLNKHTQYPLQITVENLDKNKSYLTKTRSRNLRIKLTNNSDTSFSFLMMTCSWHGCVRFAPAIAFPNYFGCDRNFPEKITLKPKDTFKLDFNYSFLLKKKLQRSIILSVGVRIVTAVPDDFTKSMSVFFDDPKYTNKDFIWSKSISIAF